MLHISDLRHGGSVLFAVAALSGVAAGCDSARAEAVALPARTTGAARAAVGVRALAPQTRLGPDVLQASGVVRSRREATMSAPATGRIVNIFVDVGDRVKSGQPLAQIDAAMATLAVEQAVAAERVAEVALEAARIDLDRATKLHEAGTLPDASFEHADNAHRQAVASLERARAAARAQRQDLGDHTVRAPFAGVVTARAHEVGDTVTMMPPTPIVTITDVDHLELRAAVPEGIAASVHEGQTLLAKTSPDGAPLESKIRVVGSVVDASTRTVEVIADVTAAPRGMPRPGTLVGVEIGAESVPGPFLPASAVFQGDDGKPFVWIVDGDVAHRRTVEVQPVAPGTVRVTKGLASELVIVEGGSALREDATVHVASDDAPNGAKP
jgi:RND family efflux transporter MFP subunit